MGVKGEQDNQNLSMIKPLSIQGLLPLLEGIQKQSHLRNFAGQTLGADAYGWLHRGTFACATDLAQGRPTRGYVNFAMNRVRMLLHFGVTPYVVFDGDYLPSKAHTERERAQRRRESRQRGLSLLQSGKSQQAAHELQKSIDVTPLMARELIEELKTAGISYVVAPYEADSQLTYMEKQGLISGIISEDSDLLVFGASRLITKLDQYGECVMIRRQDFTQCREISLINWTDKDFRMMAMLSGCDYLPGIDGLGLKTAYRLVRKYKTIEAIVRNLQFDGKKKVPAGFLEDFHKADKTFLYQWVYCPNLRQLVNLNSVPSDLSADDMPYIGSVVSPELARGVANGDLDPNTKTPLTVPRAVSTLRRGSGITPSTPSLKPKKPISEYFKAQRTPLAELDPNSFTPSPSQQRLLSTQQNRSWSASGSGMSASDAPRRSSLQSSRHSLAAEQSAKSARLSPRRKRFCADVLADFQTNTPSSTVSVASPYFANAARRSKHANFELFADDAVAETIHLPNKAAKAGSSLVQDQDEGSSKVIAEPNAGLSTAKTTGGQSSATSSPKKRKRLEVYQDLETIDLSTIVSPESQQSKSSTSISQSLISQHSIVTTTSFIDSQDALGNVAPQQPLSDFRRLSAPFLYEPVNALKEDVDLPETPVQHAGDQVPVLSDPEDFVVRASSPASTSKGQIIAHGSEDILVAQSPSSPEDEDSRHRPRPDLSRFMFAA